MRAGEATARVEEVTWDEERRRNEDRRDERAGVTREERGRLRRQREEELHAGEERRGLNRGGTAPRPSRRTIWRRWSGGVTAVAGRTTCACC